MEDNNIAYLIKVLHDKDREIDRLKKYERFIERTIITPEKLEYRYRKICIIWK